MSNLLDNRYRVTSVLGSGGFGETYLAEDTKMPSKRRCVIKQLKPVADNSQMYELLQQRFHREAAVLEALGEESRYIPKLYANFTENGLFYLVQEWIDGLTLTQEIESIGKWKEDAVRKLMISVLEILVYVHERGIIHRDIKPDNIILRNGEPVLIDFGAVKETLNVSTIRNSSQQAHSIVIGTPGFMASEQAAGRPFFASDLYSLALTAIFSLTGQYPQQLGTDSQTGDVLWQSQVSDISAYLKAVLTIALQFDPRDRYNSAKEMLEALRPSAELTKSNSAQLAPIPPSMSNIQTVAVTPRGYTPPAIENESVYVYQSSQTPKKQIIGQLVGIMMVGGVIGAAIALGVVVTQNGGIVTLWNKFFSQPAAKVPFYFLADSAYQDLEAANRRVKKLKEQGYNDAGQFWIPDYPNLGNAQYQQVYTSKFEDVEKCKIKLQEHRKYIEDAYCAFASLNVKDQVQRVTGSDLPENPTPTPTITSTPTIKPTPTVSATPTPTVTSTPTVTPTPTKTIVKPSPDQSVRDYYNLINDRQFQNAWQNLTPTFQNDKAAGYGSFTGFWRTVDKVSVNNSRIVAIQENNAIVDIDITYQKGSQTFPERLRMNLIWNEALGQWQINETSKP
jgi:serine/threonine-protein kinase